MSASKIDSGATGTTDQLTIGATSKAADVTLYDPAGREIIKKPTTGSYLAGILIRNSASNPGNNTLIWSLFNSSKTVVVEIRRILIDTIFDGTGSGAVAGLFYLARTNTAAPTGGTAVTPTKKRTGDPASVVDLRFLDTGLTKGSLVIAGDPFARTEITEQNTGGVVNWDLPKYRLMQRQSAPIELGYLDGIGLFVGAATNIIAGLGLCGFVEWDEV
jgi:hypothetical protein